MVAEEKQTSLINKEKRHERLISQKKMKFFLIRIKKRRKRSSSASFGYIGVSVFKWMVKMRTKEQKNIFKVLV